MKFAKSSFQELDFPDLLVNIWCYTDKKNDPIIAQFEKLCVEAAQEQWKPLYLDFNYLIENLRKQNKQFYNFGKICSADKNVIYRLIYMW